MAPITHDLLPAIQAAKGFVTIIRPLPVGAVLTPALALEYACRLVEAAASAEGDRQIMEALETR